MATRLTTTREERGEVIAKLDGQVKRIDDLTYTVKSQSSMGEYVISKVDGEWICECPDNKFRYVKCKHIHTIQFSQSISAEEVYSRKYNSQSKQKQKPRNHQTQKATSCICALVHCKPHTTTNKHKTKQYTTTHTCSLIAVLCRNLSRVCLHRHFRTI